MNRRRVSVLVGLLAFATSSAAAQRLVHSERSLYRDVLVYDDNSERCMCFTRQCRVGRQSCLLRNEPKTFALDYPRLMMAGTLFTGPAPQRVLIVGLGGGTIPMALAEVLPKAQIDVVEIDPAVTRVAKRYFGFKTGPLLRVIEMDGRVYVKRALREGVRYDAILLDAFDHEYIPEHLLTREFLAETKALLTPQGVLIGNTYSSSRLYDHESTTYAAVFGRYFNLKRANRVIVARPSGLPNAAALSARASEYEAALRGFDIDARSLLSLFATAPDWDVNARVLTDQYSPANLLNR